MKSLFLFLMSSVAVAQYSTGPYIENADLYQRFVDAAPNWLVAIVPILIGVLVGARALAEILLIFAKKTESKTDDKIVSYINKGVKLLAKILGQIGVGMPNKQVEEKAEKLAQKKIK